MQLLTHPSHPPWGVDWDKTSLIIEIKLLLLLITCIETSWHSSCQFIPKNWICPLVSWPCFALGQNWLSEGFGLFSSPSQNFLFYYLTWWCHHCTSGFFQLHPVPLQPASVPGRWQGCVSSPGMSIPGVWTAPQVKANCDLHSATKGTEKNPSVISAVLYHFAASAPSSYWRE